MIDEITIGDAKYDGPGWESVSESAKDFVRRLLVIDPDQRMTATVATEHEWIHNMEQLNNEKPSYDVLNQIDECLIQYKDTSELKKIALNVKAHRSATSQILELRNIFESLDVHRDGILSMDEFSMVLQTEQSLTENDLEELFNSVARSFVSLFFFFVLYTSRNSITD
jgi:calcium-dependent protein kinase